MDFLQMRFLRDRPDALPSGLMLTEDENYYFVKRGHEQVAKLRKRAAYPTTYCQQVDAHTVILGYGSLRCAPEEEFLQIVINADHPIVVRRDVFATLPLFYAVSEAEGVFVLSNDFSFVAQNVPTTLSQAGLLETLMPNPDWRTTLWNEVKILGERTVLATDTNLGIRVHYAESRNWESSGQAGPSDPRQFKEKLAEQLESFINNFVYEDGFAFEVSGGIDSATLPLYWVHKNQQNFPGILGTMVFPGNFGTTQHAKLTELGQATASQPLFVAIDPDTDYPLARMLRTKQFYPYYTFEEIYTEALTKLASEFAAHGVKVVATGIGGDELFENTLSKEHQLLFGETERRHRRQLHYPPFFTDKLREAHLHSVPQVAPYPLPLLGVSLHGAHISRNNVYITHDIWPVTPFADVSLYKFCQGLPPHFRANKNILRAFHEAHNFPQAIYNPQQNEHFGVFFDDALASGKYDKIVNQLARSSVTEQLGLVDVALLLDAYQACKTAPEDASKRWLFYIFAWIEAEINLQLIRR